VQPPFPPPAGWGPAPGAYGGLPPQQLPPAYGFPAVAPPVFPAAPPGLYPAPDDPLVSADFNGWWRKSFRLLKAVWWQAVLLQLFWAVPLIAVEALAGRALSRTFAGLTDAPDNFRPDWHPFLQSLYYVVPLIVLTALLGLVGSLAMPGLVVQAALGGPPSVWRAVRTAIPRLPAYIGWGFLAFLLALAGFVCCFLPGYYVAVVLTVLPVVVLLERGGAIARCFRLFHANVGDALVRLFTMIGLNIVVSTVGQVLIGIVASPSDLVRPDGVSWSGLLTLTALATVVTAVSAVVLSPMTVTTYADLRARYEPFSTVYLTPSS
jgi:hypothetical protein